MMTDTSSATNTAISHHRAALAHTAQKKATYLLWLPNGKGIAMRVRE